MKRIHPSKKAVTAEIPSEKGRQGQAGTAAFPGTPALRILVVDDHAIVRSGLKLVIGEKFPGTIFGEGRNAREALDQVSRERWDVLLLDITMPGLSGLDVLKQILAIQPDVHVLVISMHPENQYAIRALKTGASGYLTKESAPEEVVHAVTKVLAGGKYVSTALAERLATRLCAPEEKAPHELLSDREYQIMLQMSTGKSMKQIGLDLSLSNKTVSTYRTRVFKKMKFKNNSDLIRYAIRERLVDCE